MSGFTNLSWQPAWRLRELVLAREVSVEEVTHHFLERIKRLNGRLNSFITIANEQALDRARILDARYRDQGQAPGSLFGVPVSVKDSYLTCGIRTTGGSLLFKTYVPQEDSVIVDRLLAADAVIVGKTNMSEFGIIPRTINRLGQEAVNPWNERNVCGGSSGGAAASVAAGFSPVSVGSDAGGSIRNPAAFCGVVGLLPGNGLVPRQGILGGLQTIGSAGPISRDVRDSAIVLQALAGVDGRDPSSLETESPDYVAGLDAGVQGLRAIWVGDCGQVGVHDAQIVKNIEAATSDIAADIGLPVDSHGTSFEAERWIEPFVTIMSAERYALSSQLYGEPAKRALLTDYAIGQLSKGSAVTASEYIAASRARVELAAEWNRKFADFDLVLSPTVGNVAPDVSEPLSAPSMIAYTFLVNLTRFPAISIPCGFVNGLPLGLQVIAKAGNEALLLRMARAIELARPWSSATPAD